MDPDRWKWGSGESGTQCRQFGRGTPDARDEKVRWRTVVGPNGQRQAFRALGEGERAVGMHETQDMTHTKCPDGQGAEDARGGGASSTHGRYASGVKVVFADVGKLRHVSSTLRMTHCCYYNISALYILNLPLKSL